GLMDRSGYIFEPRGLSRRRLNTLTREKYEGALIASLGGRRASAQEALTTIASHAVSRPVIVDVTSGDTADLLYTALGQGFDVVLANKKPLTHSWVGYERLMSACRPGGPRLKYEATVGAGLPIIDTYYKLIESGDRVLKIEGCVSGTLMHIASAVSAGPPLSETPPQTLQTGHAQTGPRH